MPTKTAPAKPAAKNKPAKTSLAKAKPISMTPVASAMAAATDVGGKSGVALRVKDLVERVTAAGDFRKKDVRDIVEVTLAELGRALEVGETLNLPPFGKLRVGRSRDLANGSMMTLKLRRVPAKTGGKKAATEGLADAGEAG